MGDRQMTRRISIKRKSGGNYRGKKGLHIIALLEAAKGLVVVVAGMGLLALIHHDAQKVAEDIVRHLHINPARQFPRIFMDAAAAATDARLWAMAIGAAVYAVIRFIEAYGLWKERVWAEWFGILSGALYLPLEIYELYRHVATIKICILMVNLLVVAWLAVIRWESGRR
jgi:uncharacterized membrane protein (DUF2068 family)